MRTGPALSRPDWLDQVAVPASETPCRAFQTGNALKCRANWLRLAEISRPSRPVSADRLEVRRRGQPHGPRLAGRDVVVAVRGRPVALVEQVLDIDLRLPGLVDP